jgi:hypothetical protein
LGARKAARRADSSRPDEISAGRTARRGQGSRHRRSRNDASSLAAHRCAGGGAGALPPLEIPNAHNKAAFDLVWQRADSILENSDSVLILGKDTGAALDTLKTIAAKLQEMGYYTYIIKEEPDKAGESVIQKVMRYALSSKFVVIENTQASGHLYEIPHVAKAAECVTVVLQEEGKGATWMFEDAYAKHKHWHKLSYQTGNLDVAIEDCVCQRAHQNRPSMGALEG